MLQNTQTPTMTAKMIYPQESIAKMILGKMVKRNPGKSYMMVKIPSGWQVAPITIIKSGMPPVKPAPVQKNNLTFSDPMSNTLDAAVYEFPYVRQTKDWLYFDGGSETSVKWIHKNKVISFEIVDEPFENTMLRFKVSKKIAKAVGLPVFVPTDEKVQ